MSAIVFRSIMAFMTGALFAAGLAMSGMVLPEKVLGFLDVFGAWDPTLLYVMGGAVAVNLVLFPLVLRRARPLLDVSFHLPTRRDIDGRLVAGAALFGVGWGMVGLCPGPALTNLVTAVPGVWLFVASMVAGILLFRLQERWRAASVQDRTADDVAGA